MTDDNASLKMTRGLQDSALSKIRSGDLDGSFKDYDNISLIPDVSAYVDKASLLRYWNMINTIDGLDVKQDAQRKIFAKQWADIIADVDADDVDALDDQPDDGTVLTDDHQDQQEPARKLDLSSARLNDLYGKPAEVRFTGYKLEDYGKIRGFISKSGNDVIITLAGNDATTYFPIGSIRKDGGLDKIPNLMEMTVWSSAPDGFKVGTDLDESTDADKLAAMTEDEDDDPIDPMQLADSIESMISSHDGSGAHGGAMDLMGRYSEFNDLPDEDDDMVADHPVSNDEEPGAPVGKDDTVPDARIDYAEDLVFMSGGKHGDLSMVNMIAQASGKELVALDADASTLSRSVTINDDKVIIPSWIFTVISGNAMILAISLDPRKDSWMKTMIKSRMIITDNGDRLTIPDSTKIFIVGETYDMPELQDQLSREDL
jgi:hypothetical protein